MLETSEIYKENIDADTELFICKADLTVVPPGADSNVTLTTSAEAELSNKSQTLNGDFNMGAKWGSLEHNRIKLDGSISFMETDGLRQFGFWSDAMCDSSGVFTVPQEINYIMAGPFDIVGITIAFDDLGNEYATDFDVAYYDESDTLLQSVNHLNDGTLFYIEQKQTGVKKIKVTVNKWNIGLRRCKVCQISPGVIFSFGSSGIYGLEFDEEVNPFSSSLTVPQTIITFDNSDGEFNIANPNGKINFLRQKMKTAPKLQLIKGERADTISMGKFYLYSWPQNANYADVSVVCRPSIAFENGNYTLTSKTAQTVQSACNHIFANIEESVTVDDELKNIEVNAYIGKGISKIDAMAMLAIACCGYWKFERDGSYSLKKYEATEVVSDLNYDKLWDKPNPVQTTKYTSCTVKYYTWNSTEGSFDETEVTVSDTVNDGSLYELPQSYFIGSAARATAVATAGLAYAKQRLTHSAEYRGDPSIEAGDCVTVENDFAKPEVFLLKHVITFDSSGVTGKIEGIGVD